MNIKDKIQYLMHGRDEEMQQLRQEQASLKNQLEVIRQQYDSDCHHQISGITRRLLYVRLHHKNVYLIDYENIPMLPSFITEDPKGVCYIFIGNLQRAKSETIDDLHQFAGLHYMIQVNRQHKNALDTLLSFYLGQIYSAFEPDNVFVVSNDSDYANLKQLALYYPNVHYEQITLDTITRYQQNKTSDTFFQRFLLDYIRTFPATQVQRSVFVQRLRGSKVHGMETTDIQYALQRMKKMHLIEEYSKYGKRYVHLLHDNIIALKDSIPQLQKTTYAY